jgi:hypothetical protein
MIAWYLPARGSSVTPVEARTNGSFLHVESAGGPADLVNNATTRALVSREGMVVRLSHTHVPTRGNRTVVVRFRYLPGPATVDRPTWLDDPDGWTATLDRRDPANRSGTGGTARG